MFDFSAVLLMTESRHLTSGVGTAQVHDRMSCFRGIQLLEPNPSKTQTEARVISCASWCVLEEDTRLGL